MSSLARQCVIVLPEILEQRAKRSANASGIELLHLSTEGYPPNVVNSITTLEPRMREEASPFSITKNRTGPSLRYRSSGTDSFGKHQV